MNLSEKYGSQVIVTFERTPTPDDLFWRAVAEDGTAGEWIFGDPVRAFKSLSERLDFDLSTNSKS